MGFKFYRSEIGAHVISSLTGAFEIFSKVWKHYWVLSTSRCCKAFFLKILNMNVHRCHIWRALVLWLFVILWCSTLGPVCSVTAASIMLPAATRLITPITTPPPSTSLVLHPHSAVFIVSWKVGNVWNAFCICIYISVGGCVNLYECDKSKSRVFVIRNVIFWDTTFGGWGAELGLDTLFVSVGDSRRSSRLQRGPSIPSSRPGRRIRMVSSVSTPSAHNFKSSINQWQCNVLSCSWSSDLWCPVGRMSHVSSQRIILAEVIGTDQNITKNGSK